MRFGGYQVRIDTIASCAKDDRGWYGLHFLGFGDDAGEPQVDWQPAYGFAARPVDASVVDGRNVGCNGFWNADGQFSWCGHDSRYVDRCPDLTEGSVALWNYKGAKVHFDAAAGTADIYLPISWDSDGAPTGGHSIAMTSTIITVEHNSGTKIEMTSTGVTITASATVVVNSPQVVLGSAGGNPVACVGDLVSVAVPAMYNSGGPVVPVNPAAVTTSGGVMAVGQIISGRAGVTA